MKRESLMEKLQSVRDGADPSEALEWIMGENGSDINREKSAAKSAISENKGLKEQLDDLKSKMDEIETKNMTSEEQLAKAKLDYESKLNELNVKANCVDAKAALTGAGLTSEEADSLVSRFVTADSKVTADTVNALLGVFASRKEAVEAETKQSMLQGTPNPSAGASGAKADYQRAYEEAASRNDSVAMAAAIRNGYMQGSMTD